jgi:hypothetical protein
LPDIFDGVNYIEFEDPVMPISAKFGHAAVAFASTALAALLLLHVLRADLSLGSHMISEYAVGRHGWMMTLSFVAFGCASWALVGAAAPYLRTVAGRAGLVFLGLAGIGAWIGGIFAMDPTTSDPERMSASGHLHGVGFMIGVPSQLLAVLLLAIAARKVEAWSTPQLALLAALVWSSVALMVPLLLRGTGFGVPNRLFMLFYAAFVIAAAWPIASGRAPSRSPSPS